MSTRIGTGSDVGNSTTSVVAETTVSVILFRDGALASDAQRPLRIVEFGVGNLPRERSMASPMSLAQIRRSGDG